MFRLFRFFTQSPQRDHWRAKSPLLASREAAERAIDSTVGFYGDRVTGKMTPARRERLIAMAMGIRDVDDLAAFLERQLLPPKPLVVWSKQRKRFVVNRPALFMYDISTRMVAPVAFALFLAVLPPSADAHMAQSGWKYPIECCSMKDCKVYPAQNVKPGPNGWILHDGVVVPFDRVEPSPDGKFHRCDSSMGIITRWDNGKVCFFVPGAQG